MFETNLKDVQDLAATQALLAYKGYLLVAKRAYDNPPKYIEGYPGGAEIAKTFADVLDLLIVHLDDMVANKEFK